LIEEKDLVENPDWNLGINPTLPIYI